MPGIFRNYFIRILDIAYEFPFTLREWVYGVTVIIPSCGEGDPGSIPGGPIQQFFSPNNNCMDYKNWHRFIKVFTDHIALWYVMC